ncbi:MAG: formate/nitrite transporter family protein [Sneathiella sp.]|uniref:formate/nitrite transporter family protein n=1 Tax=Sneathiella sp. TaxID=1964365 RepID=UPI0030034F9B
MKNVIPPVNNDAYAPDIMAMRVENVGVAKAGLGFIQTFMLAVLAGSFIALGAAFYTVVMTESGLGFGPARMLGGLAFSLGLILVIVGGAELFTGNNLIVMAWADGKVSHRQLLRNWGIVYIGNFVGSLFIVFLVALSGTLDFQDGAVGTTAMSIANSKIALTFEEAFFRGILCNILVCLAVWLCFSARSVIGKIAALLFPISAFVALGFEHSVANMYLLPLGYFAGSDSVTITGFFLNLIPVTLGNILGGSGFVALTYWLVYLRRK